MVTKLNPNSVHFLPYGIGNCHWRRLNSLSALTNESACPESRTLFTVIKVNLDIRNVFPMVLAKGLHFLPYDIGKSCALHFRCDLAEIKAVLCSP